MGARQRLVLLAGVSGTVLILLGRTAHGAAEQLAKVPPQSWGLSELSDAVVAGTCACGTLGALWHVVSALLALMTLPTASGTTPLRPGGASALAARVLQAWGAPVVRRITASALLVSLSSAPALAAQETGGGDDLGWRPTSSAPASPPSQPVVDHCPSAARRLRPRTDRAGLAGPVSRQLRGDRRRSVLDPARHGPEHPGLPARTGHDDRRPGAITMNRHASAPAPSTADIERRPDPPHTPCPPGTPPTVRSPL